MGFVGKLEFSLESFSKRKLYSCNLQDEVQSWKVQEYVMIRP